MITSHYAEPAARIVATPAALRNAPSDDAPLIGELSAGDDFVTLDDSLGWAWGYAGPDRRVGYVRSDNLRR